MTVLSHVSVLQCVVVVYYYCNTLQHIYCYNTLPLLLQHTAFTTTTHCNTLQHTATHCNTLQHTYYYNTLPLLQETRLDRG